MAQVHAFFAIDAKRFSRLKNNLRPKNIELTWAADVGFLFIRVVVKRILRIHTTLDIRLSDIPGNQRQQQLYTHTAMYREQNDR